MGWVERKKEMMSLEPFGFLLATSLKNAITEQSKSEERYSWFIVLNVVPRMKTPLVRV